MEISYSEIDKIKIVKFSGRIIYDTEDRVKKELDKIIKDNTKQIVFNLTDLTYINSSGLGLLINVLKQVRANSGDIKLSNLRPELSELFRITSLNSVFDIFNEEADAVAKFQQQSA